MQTLLELSKLSPHYLIGLMMGVVVMMLIDTKPLLMPLVLNAFKKVRMPLFYFVLFLTILCIIGIL
jgi:hypothetical protein